MSGQILVVAGMHRSGTSLLTRGLATLGVCLGANLTPANMHNPRGYWEDLDIVELNIELLRILQREWHSLTPVSEADVDALVRQGYLLRAVELLRMKISGHPNFGFKDPRTTKLLPFWKKVFAHAGFETCYILATRHPLSVSKSLAKRNTFDLAKGYLLWLEHVVNSLDYTKGERRVLVDYDLLMESPSVQLARVAARFNLRVDEVELEKFHRKFLDQNLRHNIYLPADLGIDGIEMPLVSEVYRMVSKIAREEQDLEAPALNEAVERWRRELDRWRPLLGLGDRLEGICSEKEQVIRTLSTRIDETDKELSELREETIRLSDWGVELERQLRDARSESALLMRSRAWRVRSLCLRFGRPFSIQDGLFRAFLRAVGRRERSGLSR